MENKKKINMFIIGLLSIFVLVLIGIAVLFATGKISLIINNKLIEKSISDDNKPVDVYKVEKDNNEEYSINDVIQINNYLKKIYSYYENTIPEFDDINLADENWLWSVSYFYKEYNDIPYNIVSENADDLFGMYLNKKLPKSNINVASYDSNADTFSTFGRGGPVIWPMYAITEINKKSLEYEVKIIEYKIDRTGGFKEGLSPDERVKESGKIYLWKNENNGTRIKEFKVGEEKLIEDYVLNNKKDFNSKLLTFSQDVNNKKIYIKSSKNIIN